APTWTGTRPTCRPCSTWRCPTDRTYRTGSRPGRRARAHRSTGSCRCRPPPLPVRPLIGTDRVHHRGTGPHRIRARGDVDSDVVRLPAGGHLREGDDGLGPVVLTGPDQGPPRGAGDDATGRERGRCGDGDERVAADDGDPAGDRVRRGLDLVELILDPADLVGDPPGDP